MNELHQPCKGVWFNLSKISSVQWCNYLTDPLISIFTFGHFPIWVPFLLTQPQHPLVSLQSCPLLHTHSTQQQVKYWWHNVTTLTCCPLSHHTSKVEVYFIMHNSIECLLGSTSTNLQKRNHSRMKFILSTTSPNNPLVEQHKCLRESVECKA